MSSALGLYLWAACLGMGLVQFYCVVLLWRHLWRESSGKAPLCAQPVVVVVPCKGNPDWLRGNIESLLEQDYAGTIEFVFVFASDSDPGLKVVRDVISERVAVHAVALVSRTAAARTSEQLANILFGLEHISAGERVLVFAPSDVRVPRHCIRDLVAALFRTGAHFAGTAPLAVPEGCGLGGFLHMLWTGMTLSYMPARPEISSSGPYAVRRSDFDRWGIARLWGVSFVDDAPLFGLVRRVRAKVCFVGGAAPVSFERADIGSFFSQYRKWFISCRVYAPQLWFLSGLYVLGKAGILFLAAGPARSFVLFGACLLVDMLHLGMVFWILRRFLSDRFQAICPHFRCVPAWAALGAPLIVPTMACHLAGSALSRGVRWAGYYYRIRGPRDIEALRLDDPGHAA
ncbi:MAG: glycosyltransferase family 2 protein [Elusimicrobia bacterium]|nr:glycosyltransferase family 2 protein [Elusimicrobiota bacterium]